jgi:hypothetical protein
MPIAENPRAVIGGNLGTDAPDFARQEVERLEQDYALVAKTAEDLAAEAEPLPDEIPDDDGKEVVVDLIKRMRDTAARAEALRVAEKEPHFRRGQGVDQFFFRIIDKLARRDRKNKPGIADDLQARLTRYDTRKLEEERARLRRIAEEEARKAAAIRAEQERLAREAEEKRLAAERARKPETQAVKEAQAQQAEAAAFEASVETEIADRTAEEAYVGTLAKPADLMRTRTAGGTLSTVARENYAEIVDVSKLDMAVLWPLVTFEAKERALKQWARSTGFTQQMDGAAIGSRPKSVVR